MQITKNINNGLIVCQDVLPWLYIALKSFVINILYFILVDGTQSLSRPIVATWESSIETSRVSNDIAHNQGWSLNFLGRFKPSLASNTNWILHWLGSGTWMLVWCGLVGCLLEWYGWQPIHVSETISIEFTNSWLMCRVGCKTLVGLKRGLHLFLEL